MELLDHELRALEAMSEANGAWGLSLSSMALSIRVESRSINEAGHFTTFGLADSAEKLDIPLGIRLPIVILIDHPLLQIGGAFALYISGGRVEALEGFSYADNDWISFLESKVPFSVKH